MRKIIRNIKFAAAILLATQIVFGRDSSDVRLFSAIARVGALYNYHLANFKAFDGAAYCGVFERGDGLAPAASFSLEFPISRRWNVALGALYSDRSAELTNVEGFYARDTAQMLARWIDTENLIDAKLQYIDIQADINYALINNFISGPLRANFSIRTGILLNNDYKQTERIISPEDAVFVVDGFKTKERSLSSGAIRTIVSPIWGISAGVENMLKTGGNSYFTQRFTLDYNISNLVSDAEWKALGVRFEIGVGFDFNKEAEIIEKKGYKPIPIDTASIDTIYSFAKEGIKSNIEIVDFEGEIYYGKVLLATLPYVNAVFFELGSAQIPTEYRFETADTNRVFSGFSPDIHYRALELIAGVAIKNPKSTIKLIGATSGLEDEPKGKKLALRRAIAVKNALVNLGVGEKRINVESRIYPEYPSNQKFEKGAAENRRCDILIENALLQEYVSEFNYKTLEGKYDIEIQTTGLSDSDDAKMFVDDNIFRDSLEYRKIPKRYFREINSFNEVLQFEENALLFARDSVFAAADSILVNCSELPKTPKELDLSKFNAILTFEYDRAELKRESRNLLKQLVDLLPAGTVVTVSGGADELGMKSRNEQLEKERAENAIKFMKTNAKKELRFDIIPGGHEKFPEDTPQGRFLNRSIQIRLRR